jgi:hypothetical protein
VHTSILSPLTRALRPTRLAWVIVMAVVAVLATLTSGAFTSPASAACPDQSYVGMWKSNSSGDLLHGAGNSITTLAPGGIVQITRGEVVQGYRYVALGGVVKPGTTATYRLTGIPQVTWTTNPARSNGVIHHDDELRRVDFVGGASASITVEFTDKCDGSIRTVFLGSLRVIP